MISAIYAAPAALLILWLSLNVIKLRHREGVNLGDGDSDSLRLAIATQSNAVEYIPIALLLLFALEANGSPLMLIHALGVAILGARLLHAQAMLRQKVRHRVRAMQITLWSLIVLALANLIFVPWDRVFSI